MTEIWDASHVRQVLASQAPDIDVVFFEASTATSQLAAEQIGCELGQIAKSIVFWVVDKPVVVVTSGDQRVDDRKLALYFDVPRKRIRTANAEECIAVTGYAPGGVPPLAHRRDDITLFVDASLARFSRIFAAAGASNAIMPLTVDRLLSLTGGMLIDMAKSAETGSPPESGA
ncbi:MAG: YbaK/EbsC family protein [Anaerolineae bacterium]|nr:YbaK/EbsC family protein [Chloroflexota bacterium]MBP6298622.1 YbaK/EbsC family protein [Anaerolineae bacterium]